MPSPVKLIVRRSFPGLFTAKLSAWKRSSKTCRQALIANSVRYRFCAYKNRTERLKPAPSCSFYPFTHVPAVPAPSPCPAFRFRIAWNSAFFWILRPNERELGAPEHERQGKGNHLYNNRRRRSIRPTRAFRARTRLGRKHASPHTRKESRAPD